MRLTPLALLVLTVACANPDRRTRDRGDTPLTFTNHSQRDVCGLHLAPADARVWGKSWLTDAVHVGARTTLAVKPGHYMLRAHACNARSTVLLLYDVDVTAAREVVLHEPGASEAPTVGQRDGFALARWRHAGFDLRAVADIAPNDMAKFAAAVNGAIDGER